jgi:hypothetical protein
VIVVRIKNVFGRVNYLFLIVIVLAILSSSVLANVVIFEEYETKNILDKGTLKVEKNINIKNRGTNPIIPGELHFKVYEYKGKKQVASNIDNLYAHNNYNKLSAQVIRSGDFSDVVVDVWNPLLPDFEIPVTITYDLKYNQKGILFHELNFPVEETTVPVDSSSIKLFLPKNFFITYAPKATITEDSMYKIVEWENPDYDVSLEYTRLPMPKMPFKFSTMFWLTVIFILVGVTVYLNFFFKKK